MSEVLDLSELNEKPDPQLRAARYAMHVVRAMQYARLHCQGFLTEEQAKQEYINAMENFDQIIAEADDVRSAEAEMAKGSDAVLEMIEAIKNA